MFQDRIRLDVQTRTPGVDFEEAYSRRNIIEIEGVPISFLSLHDLIAAKQAAGRPRDEEDLRILRSLPREG